MSTFFLEENFFRKNRGGIVDQPILDKRRNKRYNLKKFSGCENNEKDLSTENKKKEKSTRLQRKGKREEWAESFEGKKKKGEKKANSLTEEDSWL